MSKEYAQEVLDAAKRVAEIFQQGCDRCDGDDLAVLEKAGLMDQGVCRDDFGHDTLEVGDMMWTFNETGRALVKSFGFTL